MEWRRTTAMGARGDPARSKGIHSRRPRPGHRSSRSVNGRESSANRGALRSARRRRSVNPGLAQQRGELDSVRIAKRVAGPAEQAPQLIPAHRGAQVPIGEVAGAREIEPAAVMRDDRAELGRARIDARPQIPRSRPGAVGSAHSDVEIEIRTTAGPAPGREDDVASLGRYPGRRVVILGSVHDGSQVLRSAPAVTGPGNAVEIAGTATVL